MSAHPLEHQRGNQVACLVVEPQLTQAEVLPSIPTQTDLGQLMVASLEG